MKDYGILNLCDFVSFCFILTEDQGVGRGFYFLIACQDAGTQGKFMDLDRAKWPGTIAPIMNSQSDRNNDQNNGQKNGDRLTGRDWLMAWTAALLTGLSRVAISDRRGFWMDEYYTLRAAQMNLRDLALDRLNAGHSPLYFFYAKLGLLVGHEEWMLRLTSALALAALVVIMTGLIGALKLRRTLPAFWMLAFVCPYWITVGTEYRYMMPVIAMAAAAGWALVRYAGDWRAGRGVILALLLGVLLWLHGSAQFLVAAFLLFFLWEARAREGGWGGRVWLKCWPILAGFLASVPLMILVHGHPSEDLNAKPAKIGEMHKDVCEVVFARSDLWADALGVRKLLFFLPQVIIIILAIALARRELRAQGKETARRFLGALIVGTLLAQIVVTSLARQVEGPARYLAAYSIPMAICLAVAWNASGLGPWRRRCFRGGLALILITQAAAAALDRGDLQRETIQWLMARHSGSEKILVSSAVINTFAFNYLGFPHPELVAGLQLTKKATRKEVAERAMRKVFTSERRGFLFLYKDRAGMMTRLDELEQAGFIVADRRWRVGHSVRVAAFIRDASQKGWLDSLPPPPKFRGPASGALGPKERRREEKAQSLYSNHAQVD